MLNTFQLLDLAKKHLALAHKLPLPMSDYRLGKLMKIKQGTLSNWRTGKSGIGPEFAQQFAEVCELPPAFVLACIEHERTHDESVKHIFEVIADAFASHAAAVILSVTLGATALISGQFPADPEVTAVHLHKLRKRRDRSSRVDVNDRSARELALA